MSTSEEPGRIAKDHSLTHEDLVNLSKTLNEKGYPTPAIAHILRIPESTVHSMISSEDKPEIEWGYNCLTQGVHHGRPEKLWNLPLIQAAHMFSGDQLRELVVYRIYTDALIYVNCGVEPRPSEEWAEKVKKFAEDLYSNVFQRKIGEVSEYYRSSECTRDQLKVIERVKDNRLNPNYEPLHPHDSINMLCRIIGTSASIQARSDLSP